MEDVGGDDPRMQRRAERVEPGEAELAVDHRVVRERAAGAAVLLRHRGAQEPGRARLGPHLALVHALLVPAIELRDELGADEPARLLLEQDHILGHPGGRGQVENAHGGEGLGNVAWRRSPRKPAPDLIGGGRRFAEKDMRQRVNLAATISALRRKVRTRSATLRRSARSAEPRRVTAHVLPPALLLAPPRPIIHRSRVYPRSAYLVRKSAKADLRGSLRSRLRMTGQPASSAPARRSASR